MSRNRKPLTLGEKLRVIEEAEKRTGSTKASIARDLNIPESSLKTILAKKDSILLNASKFGLNRKAAKDGKYAAMEKALVEWLRQARSAAIAVDGAILKEKADMIALRCGIDDFKPPTAG
nr:major centromere autoantigen B-like [Rhipicephalus microplus]